MEKRLNNKKQMIDAVNGVLTSNNTVWENMTPFAEMVSELRAAKAEIEQYHVETSVTTDGITNEKQALKDLLVEQCFQILSLLQASANRSGNHDLAGKTAYTESTLYNARQTDLVRIATETLALAVEQEALLTTWGIGTEQIETLRQSATRYSASVPETRTTISGRSAASEKLSTLFASATTLFDKQLDPAMELYRRTNTQFYTAYQNARKIVHYGTRHDKGEDGKK